MGSANSQWDKTLNTTIWIFSIDRGMCALIRTPLNHGIIFDMGGCDEFHPPLFIKKHILPKLTPYVKGSGGDSCPLAQIVLSHPHEDHICEIDHIDVRSGGKKSFYPALITCPHDKEPDNGGPNERVDFKRIISEDGENRERIDAYRALYAKRELPLQTCLYQDRKMIPNVEYGLYYIRPPVINEDLWRTDDHEYGNALSIMGYFRHGQDSILLPGDMNPKGMAHILGDLHGIEKRMTRFCYSDSEENPTWHKKTSDQPTLSELLKQHGLSILVAPHHGLESGFSTDLYARMKSGKPGLVVISECRHTREGHGAIDDRYRGEDGSKGQRVLIDGIEDFRHSVSTCNGHHIRIDFRGDGRSPLVQLATDPLQLV